MRFKRRKASYRLLAAALFLAAVFMSLPVVSHAADKPVHILVVYPEEADRISGEDCPAALGQVIVSLGYNADYMEAGNAKGHLNDYDQVIWCATMESDRLSPSMLEGYEGKKCNLQYR